MKYRIIGIIIVLVGLVLKTIFNHNVEYWFTIKNISLILFFIGLGIIQYPLWEKIDNGIKSEYKKNKKKWIINRGFKITLILFYVLLIVVLEQTGKQLNFELRKHYLSEKTIKTIGKIIDYKKLHIYRSGEEEFYVIEFKHNGQKITKGLINEYDLKENKNSEIYSLKNGELKLNKVIGSRIKIEYSEKYPSFLKIIE
ncbi:hypothetical protein [uncultured Polaribacter sp.]|uniref:hypothetical protein n=1 Tax=uncultured Polaribacter sp. TaxID=174711 RepID=UPI00261A492C|nr:hypothetical protein [uncultured Polaribacter sp.]